MRTDGRSLNPLRDRRRFRRRQVHADRRGRKRGFRQPIRQKSTSNDRAPSRVRATASLASTGMRHSSFTPGTNHAVSGVLRVRGHREAEFRRADRADLLPGTRAVSRAEYAVVVLHPHRVGRRRALHQPMHVLHFRRELLRGRRVVFGVHSIGRSRQFAPPSSVIQTPPVDTPTVTWSELRGSTQIEADTCLIETSAHPFLAFRHIPKRLIQRPRLAMVLRQEERTGDSSAPEPSGLIGAACLQAEDVGQARSIRFALGKGGRRNLLPGAPVVA